MMSAILFEMAARVRAAWRPTLVAVVALLAVAAAFAQDAAGSARDAATQSQAQALGRASDSVVGVQVLALEDATSNDTLGRVRKGSGVVIGDDDLVLTIGYLITEAEQIVLVTDDGRVIPARIVAYDVATGFGLLRSLAPLNIAAAPLGNAAAVGDGEPLMVTSGGVGGAISLSRLVSRRPFAGYWEYHIDGALFTSPARTDHSGAGLFDAQGRLVGIGSLFVTDALGDDAAPLPGNMFVPIDLLPPILGELIADGRSQASRRAWLGLNCVERGGLVRVVHVNLDSPAEAAGVQPGDRIVRIDGTEVHSLDSLWEALWRGGRPERDVVLDVRRAETPHRITLHSVDRVSALKRPPGI